MVDVERGGKAVAANEGRQALVCGFSLVSAFCVPSTNLSSNIVAAVAMGAGVFSVTVSWRLQIQDAEERFCVNQTCRFILCTKNNCFF